MTDEVLKVLSTLDDEQIDIVIKYFHARCGAKDMTARERQEAFGRFTTMLFKELNPHQHKALVNLNKDIWAKLEQFESNLYEKTIQAILQAKKEYTE